MALGLTKVEVSFCHDVCVALMSVRFRFVTTLQCNERNNSRKESRQPHPDAINQELVSSSFPRARLSR